MANTFNMGEILESIPLVVACYITRLVIPSTDACLVPSVARIPIAPYTNISTVLWKNPLQELLQLLLPTNLAITATAKSARGLKVKYCWLKL